MPNASRIVCLTWPAVSRISMVTTSSSMFAWWRYVDSAKQKGEMLVRVQGFAAKWYEDSAERSSPGMLRTFVCKMWKISKSNRSKCCHVVFSYVNKLMANSVISHFVMADTAREEGRSAALWWSPSEFHRWPQTSETLWCLWCRYLRNTTGPPWTSQPWFIVYANSQVFIFLYVPQIL